MRHHRRWGIVGLVGAFACLGLLLVRSGAQETVVGQSAARFFRVGPYRINVDQVCYTRDEGDKTVVRFGGVDAPSIFLTGDDSRAFRQYLDGQGRDSETTTRRRKPILEGVDINTQPAPDFPAPAPRN